MTSTDPEQWYITIESQQNWKNKFKFKLSLFSVIIVNADGLAHYPNIETVNLLLTPKLTPNLGVNLGVNIKFPVSIFLSANIDFLLLFLLLISCLQFY